MVLDFKVNARLVVGMTINFFFACVQSNLEVEYGQIYQQLFDGRQAGDYEDFVYHDKEMYESLAPWAEKFIKRIREIVEES